MLMSLSNEENTKRAISCAWNPVSNGDFWQKQSFFLYPGGENVQQVLEKWSKKNEQAS